MNIPEKWDLMKTNEMCFNCNKATDGRRCPWADKRPRVPDGAIAWVVPYNRHTIKCNQTIEETYRIMRCPNFEDALRKYHGEEDYKASVTQLCHTLYDNYNQMKDSYIEVSGAYKRLRQSLRDFVKYLPEAEAAYIQDVLYKRGKADDNDLSESSMQGLQEQDDELPFDV